MLVAALLVVVGLILLLGGADVLVRGVSALAEAVGVPPVAIGLTVVAFGTSTPELVINSFAAFNDETALAFGNIVGSCTINIGWVLALTALIRPLCVEPSIITREIPMMLLATAAIIVMSADRLLDGEAVDLIGRGNGILLLLLFGVFLYYTIQDLLRRTPAQRARDPLVEEVIDAAKRKPTRPAWVYVVMTLAGVVAVAAGGRMAVIGAVGLAQGFGVPEVIIGLTIISLGTTLPELTTGIVAARRGEGDIAIGNIVGSNIFNLLFIGGTVSVIRPIDVPNGGHLDLLMMAALSVALLPIAIRGPRKITRAEGGILLAAYLSYAAWRAIGASAAANG